jgi:hypothetical protein
MYLASTSNFASLKCVSHAFNFVILQFLAWRSCFIEDLLCILHQIGITEDLFVSLASDRNNISRTNFKLKYSQGCFCKYAVQAEITSLTEYQINFEEIRRTSLQFVTRHGSAAGWVHE